MPYNADHRKIAVRTSSDNKCGHLDRPYHGNGLCDRCYRRSKTEEYSPYGSKAPRRLPLGEFATCHPHMRMHHSSGLCSTCYNAMHEYGADFKVLYEQQDGICKVCRESFDNSRIVVDHNHTTGAVRGLVCDGCNIKIGVIESALYETVLAYLKDHE
jgi:hypothetical protein